jgi:predicted PurR-regulated permease PerM
MLKSPQPPWGVVAKPHLNDPVCLVLMSQVLFGVLYGALGVLVAVPLAAVAMVLLRELDVKDVLREPA